MLAGIGLVQPGESSHPSQSSANTSLSWTSIPPAPTPPCGRQHSILTSSSPVHLGIQSTLLCWVLPFPSGTFHTFTPLLSSHQSLPIMPIDGQRKLTWPSPRSTEEVSPLGISYSWETAVFLPLVVQGLLRPEKPPQAMAAPTSLPRSSRITCSISCLVLCGAWLCSTLRVRVYSSGKR